MSTVTREQLYELVWSEALQALAKRIGCSNVYIAKVCGTHRIPVPPRGYWNKRHAGKAPKKSPLPHRDLATAYLVDLPGALSEVLRARIWGEPGDVLQYEDIAILTERFCKRLGRVTVPKSRAALALKGIVGKRLTYRGPDEASVNA